MKKIILTLIALTVYYSVHAQCPPNAYVTEIIDDEPHSIDPSNPMYDSACLVAATGFLPNSLVYIYNNSSVLIDSIKTDNLGDGFSTTCLNFFFSFEDSVGTAVSGDCSISIRELALVPIKLTNFTASISDNKVKCNWQMESETPNTLYELQQSDDGIIYKTIYDIKSGKNSFSSHQYQYILQQPITHKQFYRLKYTEQRGGIKYSEIKNVSPENYGGIQVYPSVTNNQFSVNASADYVNGQVKIYNTNGIVVYQNKINSQVFNVTANWSRGVYYIRAISSDGSNNSLKKIVIQ